MAEGGSSETVALLRGTSLFSALGDEELASLAGFAELIAYPRGAAVFRAGDPSDALFIVKEGEVAVSKEAGEGRSITLATFIPGDCFGELDFFARTPRNAAAVAEKDAVLLVFPRQEVPFENLIGTRPKLFAKVLHTFLTTVAQRIRATNQLLTENVPWVKVLRRQALTDSHTGLFTKPYLEEEYPSFLAEPTALIMLKPDNFKQMNDAWGHKAGDGAMKLLSAMLPPFLGAKGFGVRYRGNELAVVLPGCSERAARQAAERLRQAVKELDLSSVTGSPEFRLSASLSVVVHRRADGEWPEAVASAYRMMYRARKDGGDRVYAD
jgi:diguanylate cyclase (GGDEF)-like protein